MRRENDIKILTANPNEAISDSLVRALRWYDMEINKKDDFVTLWRRNVADNTGIGDLRKILSSGNFNFLEGGEDLAQNIKKVVEDRKSRTPDGGDPLTKTVFEYLDARLKYAEQKTRRDPLELTAQYKILLIGDGWVDRSDPDNPLVKEVKKSLNSADEKTRMFGKALEEQLRLENRGFTPDQVYTVDKIAAQLPDLTGDVRTIKNDLPEEHFDFIYFEGFYFHTEEETQDALYAVFPSLNNEGLLLYCSSDFSIRLIAKSGGITQDKLDKIPSCVTLSINRNLQGFQPLEKVHPSKESVIVLRDYSNKHKLTDESSSNANILKILNANPSPPVFAQQPSGEKNSTEKFDTLKEAIVIVGESEKKSLQGPGSLEFSVPHQHQNKIIDLKTDSDVCNETRKFGR